MTLKFQTYKNLYWNTANLTMYMRTIVDNRLLIGGWDEDFANAKKEMS